MHKGISNPIIESFLFKLRDPSTPNKEFRETLEKLGEYFGLKLS